MATVDFHVTKYGKSRGSGAGSIASTEIRLSGQDTITTVENIEDGSGDITVTPGEVFVVHTDVALRIAFGGTAATGTTGIYIPASQLVELEVHEAGNVSAIVAT